MPYIYVMVYMDLLEFQPLSLRIVWRSTQVSFLCLASFSKLLLKYFVKMLAENKPPLENGDKVNSPVLLLDSSSCWDHVFVMCLCKLYRISDFYFQDFVTVINSNFV